MQRTGHFRFLDLPVEIRLMVFDYLVTADTPVKLKVTNFYRPGRHGIDAYCNSSQVQDKISHAIRLLLVNRQTDDEVSPIIYRSNTFDLSVRALRLLLDCNPRAANWIGRLSVSLYAIAKNGDRYHDLSQHYAKRTLRYTIKQLQRLSAVRAIRLDHKLVYHTGKYRDPVDLVNLCVPMLNRVYRQRQEQGNRAEMHEVLDFHHEGCHRNPRECVDFSKRVKREVAERFLVDFVESEKKGNAQDGEGEEEDIAENWVS